MEEGEPVICTFPLCGRETSGETEPLCWPCWSKEKKLKKRKEPCDQDGCEAVARLERHLTPRIRRKLCLPHAWKLQRNVDFLRDLSPGQTPLDEIEDQYAYLGTEPPTYVRRKELPK